MCALVKATVCVIVSETCQVVLDTLWDDTVKMYFSNSNKDFQESMANLGKSSSFHLL